MRSIEVIVAGAQRSWRAMNSGGRTDAAGDHTRAVASLDEVKANLATTGYPSDHLHFVEGMDEDTIPAVAPEEISILRLDTDWYESTRHELRHLWPRLSPGGVLIIDDYGHGQGRTPGGR